MRTGDVQTRPQKHRSERLMGASIALTPSSELSASQTTASKTRRVFLGFQEVSGILGDVSGILHDQGHRVQGAVLQNRYFGSPPASLTMLPAPAGGRWRQAARKLWNRLRIAAQLPRAVLTSNDFVFVWSITFLPWNLDLPLLRGLGKRVVLFNCGDDARFRPLHDALDRNVLHYDWLGGDSQERQEYLRSGNRFLKTFWFQKIQEKTGCRIISSRNLATFQAEPLAHFRFPQRRLVPAAREANAVPLLVHAPSNRAVKGTRYVLEAVDQLRREGHAFEFRLLENLKNTDVLETLAKADVAIDQVCGAWPGRFGIESMASGCVLVGGFRPDYCQYPETPPIVPFEPDSAKLADSLRSLILDQNRRTELMQASYEYWQSYYSPEAFVRWFQRVLDGTAETFEPLPNHKEHLLRFAENGFQRFIIRWFY